MFVLRDKESGEPIAGFKYRAEWANGEVIYGTTNERGETLRVGTGAEKRAFNIFADNR